MFYSVFSGYLNGEAKFNEVNGKGVLNFRVAVAFPKKEDNGDYGKEYQYFNCSKWYNDAKETPKILEHLKEGKKVIVEASKIWAKHEGKDGKFYTNLYASANSLELCGDGLPKEEQPEEQEEAPQENE